MMSKGQEVKGFTIVELLIVIVVIGILAAITIVAYNGVQGRASDTAVKSDMRQFAQKMELFRTDSADNTYPIGNQLNTSLGISFSRSAYKTVTTNNILYCISADRLAWTLVAQSKSGKHWVVSNTAAPEEYSGTSTYIGTSYGSMSQICPEIVTGGAGGNGNAWAYASGPPRVWSPWVN